MKKQENVTKIRSNKIIPSMPCQAVTIWFQVLFTPNQMGSFQHSLAVLNTLSVLRNIQNWKSMPPKKIHAQFPMNATQEKMIRPQYPKSTGLSPSTVKVFQQ